MTTTQNTTESIQVLRASDLDGIVGLLTPQGWVLVESTRPGKVAGVAVVNVKVWRKGRTKNRPVALGETVEVKR